MARNPPRDKGSNLSKIRKLHVLHGETANFARPAECRFLTFRSNSPADFWGRSAPVQARKRPDSQPCRISSRRETRRFATEDDVLLPRPAAGGARPGRRSGSGLEPVPEPARSRGAGRPALSARRVRTDRPFCPPHTLGLRKPWLSDGQRSILPPRWGYALTGVGACGVALHTGAQVKPGLHAAAKRRDANAFFKLPLQTALDVAALLTA